MENSLPDPETKVSSVTKISVLIGCIVLLIALTAGMSGWVSVRDYMYENARSAMAIVATLIAMIYGATEIATRYRDEPGQALVQPAAILYLAVNGVIALIVYAGIHLYNTDPVTADKAGIQYCAQVALIAGFGSLAFMRASLSRIEVSGQSMQIGPAAVLERLLSTVSREIDRKRAEQRIFDVIRSVNMFAGKSVPIEAVRTLCIDAMQGITDEENEQLATKLEDYSVLLTRAIPEEFKHYKFGMLFQAIVGTDVFRRACYEVSLIDFTEDIPLEDVIKMMRGADGKPADEPPSEQAEEVAEADPKPESTEEQDDPATNTVAGAEDAAEKPSEEAATPAQEKKLS
ncbi:MAG: hypothetical protein AAF619_03400 [Pseudomonadota bacterium]